jgi:hypothetical protein
LRTPREQMKLSNGSRCERTYRSLLLRSMVTSTSVAAETEPHCSSYALGHSLDWNLTNSYLRGLQADGRFDPARREGSPTARGKVPRGTSTIGGPKILT